MSVTLAEIALIPTGAAPVRPRSSTRVRPKPLRAPRGRGPQGRPDQVRLVAPPAVGSHSCRGLPAARPVQTVTHRAPRVQTGGWRLTDRGIAVVLVAAAALVVASVMVIGLTALRVTGESYRSTSTSTGSAQALVGR